MATESDIDPKYECDAPLYVDFEQLKQNGGLEDDGADSWFERHNDEPGVVKNELMDVNVRTVDNAPPNPECKTPQTRAKREAAIKADSSIHAILAKKPQMFKLTQPTTPDVLKRHKQQRLVSAKTSEDLELEKIKELQKEKEEHLKESKKSYKKLMAHQESEHSQEEIDTAKQKQPKRRRSSKPFKFQADNARINKLSKPKRPRRSYVPMAEQLVNFHKETPPRFRTMRRNAIPTMIKEPVMPQELTKPKTPKLVAKTRSRPVHVESAMEKEEKEAEEVESYQFKAKPFNRNIIVMGGLLGVPKVEKRPLTRAMSPTLAADTKPKKTEEDHSMLKEEFRARPVPKGILEGVKGVPGKRPVECTDPESPAFCLKKRKLEWDSKKKEASPEPVFQPQPAPPVDKPVFHPELPHKKTDVQPFRFESRYEGKPTRRDIVDGELKRQEEDLIKGSQFKANPIPNLSEQKVVRPGRKIEPEPFKLQSDLRGEKHQKQFQEKVKEMQEQAKVAAAFKASRNETIYSKPFVPEKSNKPLLQVQNFVLNTEQRSQQRKLYEMDKREREEQQARELALKKAEEEEEERKRLVEYRQSLQHHAGPIRHYKSVDILPADKQLTTPHTPPLITSQRCRNQI